MKAMKKTVSLVLAVVLCMVCFAGCKKNGGSDEQTLIIGGSGPLTGDAAAYGIAVQNGEILVDLFYETYAESVLNGAIQVNVYVVS